MPKELLDTVRCILDDRETHAVDSEDEHALHEQEQQEMELELAALGLLSDMLKKKLKTLNLGGEVAEQTLTVRANIREMCEIYRQGEPWRHTPKV